MIEITSNTSDRGWIGTGRSAARSARSRAGASAPHRLNDRVDARGELGLQRLRLVRADEAKTDGGGGDAANGNEQKRPLGVGQLDVEHVEQPRRISARSGQRIASLLMRVSRGASCASRKRSRNAGQERAALRAARAVGDRVRQETRQTGDRAPRDRPAAGEPP